MSSVIKQAKTVEEAIDAALNELGISRNQAIIKILDEGSEGNMLGFGRRAAKVEVSADADQDESIGETLRGIGGSPLVPEEMNNMDFGPIESNDAMLAGEMPEPALLSQTMPENKSRDSFDADFSVAYGRHQETAAPQEADEADEAGEAREPLEPADPEEEYEEAEDYKGYADDIFEQQPAKPVDDIDYSAIDITTPELRISEAEKFAVNYLGNILAKMDIHGRIKSYHNEEAVFIEVFGPNLGRAIGSGGETVNALQYLCNCAVNFTFGEKTRIILDIGNYRKRNNSRLRFTAKKAVDKALRTGRRVTLPPMSPQDRREIHLAVSGFRGVSSHSDGVDPYRRVTIEPERRRYRGKR